LWLVLLLILTVGVLQVVFLMIRALVQWRSEAWRRRVRGDDEDPEQSILIDPELLAPPVNPRARMDRWFQNLVQTGLGWSAGQGLAVMALTAVALGGTLLMWRNDVALALLGAAIGLLAPVGVYMILAGRRRRQVQDQLPDLYFLLARSLRAGLTLD